MERRVRMLWGINILFFVILVVLLILGRRIIGGGEPQQPKAASPKPGAPAISEPSMKTYDVSQMKTAPGEQPPQPPANLTEMYKQYPKLDVGDNIIEKWSEAKEEDKQKFTEALDMKITEAQEALKKNPEDDTAKNLLFIAQELKKLAANNFEYQFQEPQVPQEQ